MRIADSFDHPVGAQQHRLRNPDAERLGCLEVDCQREPGWLLDWQLAGVGAPQESVHIEGRAACDIFLRLIERLFERL